MDTARKQVSMTKMEACGALCEIREEIAGDLKRRQEEIKDPKSDADPRRKEWHENEAAKCKRWIRAIEMAGVALTR